MCVFRFNSHGTAPCSDTRCGLHHDKPLDPWNCSAITWAVSLSYSVSHSLPFVSHCFSVSLSCSVFQSHSLTSPQPPACLIGWGKPMQRCPKQMLEQCVGVESRNGGFFNSIPSRSPLIAKYGARNVRHTHRSLSFFSLQKPHSFFPRSRSPAVQSFDMHQACLGQWEGGLSLMCGQSVSLGKFEVAVVDSR